MNVCHILYIFRPIRVTFGITDVHNRSLYDCGFCEKKKNYIYIYIGRVKSNFKECLKILLVFTAFLVQFG